jgi:hypothetical protein
LPSRVLNVAAFAAVAEVGLGEVLGELAGLVDIIFCLSKLLIEIRSLTPSHADEVSVSDLSALAESAEILTGGIRFNRT